MNSFNVGDRVIYMRQLIGGKFVEIQSTIRKITPRGRFTIESDHGVKCSVAAYSIRRAEGKPESEVTK